MVTVITICVTWFMISTRDKKRAGKTTSNAIEDNYFVTAPGTEEEKR